MPPDPPISFCTSRGSLHKRSVPLCPSNGDVLATPLLFSRDIIAPESRLLQELKLIEPHTCDKNGKLLVHTFCPICAQCNISTLHIGLGQKGWTVGINATGTWKQWGKGGTTSEIINGMLRDSAGNHLGVCSVYKAFREKLVKLYITTPYLFILRFWTLILNLQLFRPPPNAWRPWCLHW